MLVIANSKHNHGNDLSNDRFGRITGVLPISVEKSMQSRSSEYAKSVKGLCKVGQASTQSSFSPFRTVSDTRFQESPFLLLYLLLRHITLSFSCCRKNNKLCHLNSQKRHFLRCLVYGEYYTPLQPRKILMTDLG